ncbi:MAG: outer membrane beta-barrel protein [Bacteroidales bacterium]
MKKITLLFFTLLITLGIYAQEPDSTLVEMKEELNNDIDTTNIRFKRKTVKIIDENDETKILVKKNKDSDWEFWNENDARFQGSWSGFSMGLSNYMNKDFSLSRNSSDEFMDLNTGKSWNMNLNFAQYSINLINNKFGLVTGLGLEWNYYRFDNNNTIQKDANGVIITDTTSYASSSVDKSKLSTTYATVPLLLEWHSSSNQDRGVVIAAGVIGGVKLGSNTKIVYKENGDVNKDKKRDDYNLSPFKYGVTARIGVGDWLVYGTYYLTSLFEKDKGPELYPFSVGIALSFE